MILNLFFYVLSDTGVSDCLSCINMTPCRGFDTCFNIIKFTYCVFVQVGDHPGYPFHAIPSSNLPIKEWILVEASPDQEYLQHPFRVN